MVREHQGNRAADFRVQLDPTAKNPRKEHSAPTELALQFVRPALSQHTILLGAGIPIVERMGNLEALPVSGFTFTTAPVKAKGMGSFPVRAFARV